MTHAQRHRFFIRRLAHHASDPLDDLRQADIAVSRRLGSRVREQITDDLIDAVNLVKHVSQDFELRILGSQRIESR